MSMFGAPFGIFIAMLVMDKIPRKTMGVGLLILIAVLGYILFTANQYVAHNADWFLPDYFRLYVRLLCLGSVCPRRSGRQRPNSVVRSGECGMGRISGIAAPYAVAVLLSSYGVTGVFILLGAVSIIVELLSPPLELKPKVFR